MNWLSFLLRHMLKHVNMFGNDNIILAGKELVTKLTVCSFLLSYIILFEVKFWLRRNR